MLHLMMSHDVQAVTGSVEAAAGMQRLTSSGKRSTSSTWHAARSDIALCVHCHRLVGCCMDVIH